MGKKKTTTGSKKKAPASKRRSSKKAAVGTTVSPQESSKGLSTKKKGRTPTKKPVKKKQPVGAPKRALESPEPKKRGRPKGSKNKPKDSTDTQNKNQQIPKGGIYTDNEGTFFTTEPSSSPKKELDLDLARLQRHKNIEKANKHKKEMHAAARDIAPMDWTTVNWERRLSTKHNFKLFCETYLPSVFYLGWSKDHLTCIKRIEQIFMEGGKFALAMPRGQGKTALCRAGLLWGTAHAHRRFPFLIGSQHNKALQSLEFIKTYWYRNRELQADFPEIGYPFFRVENRWQAAAYQTYNSEHTCIKWGSDELQYPCCLFKEEEIQDLQKHDPDFLLYIKAHDMYLTKNAGVVIRTSGIDGSIRGEAEVHPVTLEQPRPDAVLLDDVQKDQKAESPTSIEKLIRLIDGAVDGLSGPDELIASLMPCTVIQQNDVADTYLKQTEKPEWKGERLSMVISWPEGIDDGEIGNETEEAQAWQSYIEKYKVSLRTKGDISLATAYYQENRALMDRNFTVSWKDRYNKKKEYKGNKELSAQQHAMNLRISNPYTFASEYQNLPRSIEDVSTLLLSAEYIRNKVTNIPRYEVPLTCKHLVCYVDIQNEIFFYVVLACDSDFTGYIVDYGTYPNRATRYFRKVNAEGWNLLSNGYFKAHPGEKPKAKPGRNKNLKAPFEAKIYYALTQFIPDLFSRRFPRGDVLNGADMQIERIGIDARWGQATDTIKRFCREFRDSRVLPCLGQGVSAAQRQFEEYNRDKTNLFEDQRHPSVKDVTWIYRPSPDYGYHLLLETNRLKSLVMKRLGTPNGSPASFSLFRGTPEDHELYSHHVANSEYPEPVVSRYGEKDEWKVRPENQYDNDYLDCTAGCIALASFEGACIKGPPATKASQLSKRPAGKPRGRQGRQTSRKSLSQRFAEKHNRE